jgi:hypothetical protein
MQETSLVEQLQLPKNQGERVQLSGRVQFCTQCNGYREYERNRKMCGYFLFTDIGAFFRNVGWENKRLVDRHKVVTVF